MSPKENKFLLPEKDGSPALKYGSDLLLNLTLFAEETMPAYFCVNVLQPLSLPNYNFSLPCL